MASEQEEESKPPITTTTTKIVQEARILALIRPNDSSVDIFWKDNGSGLPKGSSIVAMGMKLEDFDLEALKEAKPNVIFVGLFGVRRVFEQFFFLLGIFCLLIFSCNRFLLYIFYAKNRFVNY